MGESVGRADAAYALVEGLRARLKAVAGAVAGRPRVRTLLVFRPSPCRPAERERCTMNC